MRYSVFINKLKEVFIKTIVQQIGELMRTDADKF